MPKFTVLRNVLPNQGIINYTIKSKLLHSQSRGAMRITLECPSVPPVAGLPVSNVYRNMACHEQIIFSCLRKLCVEWRRERDSNPRSAMRTIAFEATAFNRSAISPAKQCKVQSAVCRGITVERICSLLPVIFVWRRERDSNPRYAFWAYTRLAGERLQPARPYLQKISVKCRV